MTSALPTDAVLGIDTSCYTTSCSLADVRTWQVLADSREPVPVASGRLGARQSFAVFSHTTRLAEVIERAFSEAGLFKVVAVAASTRPTPARDSYLPVFKVSAGYGRALAVALGVPFIGLSHQVGHLVQAWTEARWKRAPANDAPVLALHLSGGTSSVLLLKRSASSEPRWWIETLGRSLDITAGQFVDRIGGKLGFGFPAGAELDRIAAAGSRASLRIPSATRGYDMSFSGACSMAERALERGAQPGDVARAAFDCIAKTCEKLVRKALGERDASPDILVVGGVAASDALRARLRERLEHPAVGCRLWFPAKRYCTDNAAGIALAGAASTGFGLTFSTRTKENLLPASK